MEAVPKLSRWGLRNEQWCRPLQPVVELIVSSIVVEEGF
jgi:hypothetical protein